jgi:hypothetical protein
VVAVIVVAAIGVAVIVVVAANENQETVVTDNVPRGAVVVGNVPLDNVMDFRAMEPNAQSDRVNLARILTEMN